MKNWRNTLTNILRISGGKVYLSEIYSQVEILGTELGSEWKAVTRGALERNCSDCDAWNGTHNVFSLKEKRSGNWSLRTNAFKKEFLDSNTNFFILTTGKLDHRDKDFEIYTWNTHKNSKLKPGDLFIYRISQKVSSNNLIYIDDSYKVKLFNEVKNDKKLFDQLKTYEGKKIFLPSNKNTHPNKKYLKMHREKIK